MRKQELDLEQLIYEVLNHNKGNTDDSKTDDEDE